MMILKFTLVMLVTSFLFKDSSAAIIQRCKLKVGHKPGQPQRIESNQLPYSIIGAIGDHSFLKKFVCATKVRKPETRIEVQYKSTRYIMCYATAKFDQRDELTNFNFTCGSEPKCSLVGDDNLYGPKQIPVKDVPITVLGVISKKMKNLKQRDLICATMQKVRGTLYDVEFYSFALYTTCVARVEKALKADPTLKIKCSKALM